MKKDGRIKTQTVSAVFLFAEGRGPNGSSCVKFVDVSNSEWSLSMIRHCPWIITAGILAACWVFDAAVALHAKPPTARRRRSVIFTRASSSLEPTFKADHVELVRMELEAGARTMVAQVAPAVRVSLGEEFGLTGVDVTGKLVRALRLLGFEYVFDVLAGADVTIVEEASELLVRLRMNLDGDDHAPPLPMFTSCCPGWVSYVEERAPEMIPHLSSCKSPHMMEGSIIKDLFRPNGDETDLSVVSIMPCVRKQGEADRLPFSSSTGARQVDHVLTTVDLAIMIKAAGIKFAALEDSIFDPFMGLGSGAGSIFGVTGTLRKFTVVGALDVSCNLTSVVTSVHPSFKNFARRRGDGGSSSNRCRVCRANCRKQHRQRGPSWHFRGKRAHCCWYTTEAADL